MSGNFAEIATTKQSLMVAAKLHRLSTRIPFLSRVAIFASHSPARSAMRDLKYPMYRYFDIPYIGDGVAVEYDLVFKSLSVTSFTNAASRLRGIELRTPC
jgi:hypothetical protein